MHPALDQGPDDRRLAVAGLDLAGREFDIVRCGGRRGASEHGGTLASQTAIKDDG